MAAEATLDPDPQPTPDPAALRDFAAKLDRANMKKIGAFHFAMVMGALTLWGAAVAWAQTTGWAIAELAAVANAVIAATVISSTLHEWGHFTGARLSDAPSPVLDAPRNHYFMFDFKMADADVRQFTWMSWGGIAVPWLLVVAALVLVPVGLTSGAALIATLVAKATSATHFELPIVRDANACGDHNEAFQRGIAGGLDASGRVGNVTGLVVFALLVLLF
ncbi:MAG: hypothetical protein AAGC67_05480 [Myxococcota bacterium]